jgi:uncharacterized protein
MPLRIVLDTNILISAIGWDGPEREILRKVFNGEIKIISSQEILTEFFNVLTREKFKSVKRSDIGRFSILILETFEMVETKTKVDLIKEDPDDNMVLECALDGGADLIVSGDKHLLGLERVGDIRIMTSRNFIDDLSRD